MHDRLFGKVPFDQRQVRSSSPPQRPADWICGEPLAFLIQVGGQRIYIDSGGTSAQLPPHERVDLAILGVALPDARLPGALEHLEPRYILPSHQDNFFRPLDAGFQFGPLTDFSRGAARLRTSESWLLNPPGLFPAMDAVDGGKSQIPRTKSQTKDRILTLTEGKAKSRRSTETGDVEAMKAMRRRIALPKHFVRNARERLAPFRLAAAGLSECARVVASLSLFSILAIEIYLEFGN